VGQGRANTWMGSVWMSPTDPKEPYLGGLAGTAGFNPLQTLFEKPIILVSRSWGANLLDGQAGGSDPGPDAAVGRAGRCFGWGT
jgi:hypothetical protein